MGGEAQVSCIRHLTSQFGRVRPQGSVRGEAVKSIAVGSKDIAGRDQSLRAGW